MYCVSLPGYIWGCGMKYTNISIQAIQDKDMIVLFESNILGGISIGLRDRYVKSDDDKKILYKNVDKLYGRGTVQSLPYDDNNFDKDPELKVILDTKDHFDLAHHLEVDLN